LLSELHYGDVQVAREASPPSAPSSPKVKRNTILGAILGLLIGISVVFLLEHFDLTIRDPRELEEIYGAPMLGAIPNSAALARRPVRDTPSGTVLPSVEVEAFNLIRAHLKVFNADRDVRTVIVVSAEPGDGKTVISCHLAAAAASLGSRVLLIEADMRNPTVAQELGIKPGPGLADVLVADMAIGDAVQTVELDQVRGEGIAGSSLSVLTAGAVIPPNPAELLEGRATRTSLEWATWFGYELVVIDTPPLSAVSDAFPLLPLVDGVIVVGRVGHSRRDAAERLQQILASSGSRLLGVVANSSKAGSPEPYPSLPSKSTSTMAPAGG
jgi:capsular exopolysaccharide synthesis family protein